MKTGQFHHAADAGLKVLLFGDEDSEEYRITAAHVETCDVCRKRLDTLAGPTDVDAEARALLNDYPWDEASPSHPDDESRSDASINLGFLGPPSHPEMLGRLGRYEIERVIGSGGMGIVLKAFDTELNRPVAIKVLVEHLAHRGAARKRFAREAKAAAAIVHEHVVAIHNVETTHDLPFLVMQYVAGESLQARVDSNGPLDAKEILRIGIQTAAGLAAAHEQGVIHRDIKPANILLEEGVERALITDFGLARTIDDASLTHTGIVAGTPHYMSPEQANGETTDHRTDLFSLGSVLYFMATGHGPFRAERAMGVLHRICYDTHRPVCETNPEIPDNLSDMIDRLLEKKPSRRFASALECKDAFTRLLSRLQQGGIKKRSWSRRRLNRSPNLLVQAAIVTVVAAVVFLMVPLAPKPQVEQSSKQRVIETIADVVSAPLKIDLAELKAESAEDATSVNEVTDQVAKLESMFNASVFVRNAKGTFLSESQLIQRSLDDLTAPTFSSSSNTRLRLESQSLHQALDHLSDSTFSNGSQSIVQWEASPADHSHQRQSGPNAGDSSQASFQREAQAIDRILDGLNGKSFPSLNQSLSNGAR